jgi:hypothetical protein
VTIELKRMSDADEQAARGADKESDAIDADED